MPELNTCELTAFRSETQARAWGALVARRINPANPPRAEVDRWGDEYVPVIQLGEATFGPRYAWARCAILRDRQSKLPVRLAFNTWNSVDCEGQSGLEINCEIDLEGRLEKYEVVPT